MAIEIKGFSWMANRIHFECILSSIIHMNVYINQRKTNTCTIIFKKGIYSNKILAANGKGYILLSKKALSGMFLDNLCFISFLSVVYTYIICVGVYFCTFYDCGGYPKQHIHIQFRIMFRIKD